MARLGDRIGQRVRILDGPAKGFVGAVARIMFGQASLWVRLDEWPEGLNRTFSDDVRRNWFAVPIAELSAE